MAVADAVTSFIAVKQRDWTRRARNRMLPYVMRQIDEARANGDSPDIKQIMEDAFARGVVPMPELS
jgi:hypothetical protein